MVFYAQPHFTSDGFIIQPLMKQVQDGALPVGEGGRVGCAVRGFGQFADQATGDPAFAGQYLFDGELEVV